jgi:hypothetical protein
MARVRLPVDAITFFFLPFHVLVLSLVLSTRMKALVMVQQSVMIQYMLPITVPWTSVMNSVLRCTSALNTSRLPRGKLWRG